MPSPENKYRSGAFDDRAQFRRLLDHVDGFGQRLFCLIFFRRYGIDFRRALIVCDKQIQRDSRKQRRFAVLSGDQKQRFAESPVSRVFFKPTE